MALPGCDDINLLRRQGFGSWLSLRNESGRRVQAKTIVAIVGNEGSDPVTFTSKCIANLTFFPWPVGLIESAKLKL